MKRRRSVLMTKNPEKVEKLFSDLPKSIKIIGKQLTREYKVMWERVGTEEYEGSRFTFTLDDLGDSSSKTQLFRIVQHESAYLAVGLQEEHSLRRSLVGLASFLEIKQSILDQDRQIFLQLRGGKVRLVHYFRFSRTTTGRFKNLRHNVSSAPVFHAFVCAELL